MALAETRLHSEESHTTVALQEIVSLVVIGTAILGGLALRWLDLGRQSLWWDEGFTVWTYGLALGRIVPFAKSDNQAPLYYLLQHYWGVLFGNSEFALRALSAFFGTLALPVFYLLAKKVLKDGIAAALAFWLFAFSMKQIWYSREARAYEAGSFFALVALCALVLFLEKRSTWAFVTVVLSSVLTLYLHNMMFFYLLSLNVVWLIYPSERVWTRRLREMLLANVCMGILYSPWVASLLAQVNTVSGNLYWVPRPTLWSVAGTLRGTAGFETRSLVLLAKKLLPLPWRVVGDSVWMGLVLLCGALLGGGFWRVSKTDARKNLCFLLYCLLPIFLVFILSQRMPLYLDRVFTTSSIAAPVILAFPLAAQKGSRGKSLYAVLGLILAGVATLSSVGFVKYEHMLAKSGEDWRGVITTVLTIPETDRLVLFVPPAGEIFFDYYSRHFPAVDTRVARTGLQEDFHDRFPPPKSRIINENDVDRLRMLVESHKYFEIDLVLAHNVDPQGLIENYLDRAFIRQEDLEPTGPIRVIPFRALTRP
ncbi:MAG TPA: glycosyltransferase family 39 protein [Candidatus Acidoferrales bacterium]|nr:glycosyltransferase family 39 protein [Candidatus Acidoferrales bacterium]